MSIVVTGGAGFIGSCVVRTLNDAGIEDIIIVDNIASTDKWMNMRNKKYITYYHRSQFLEKLPELKDVTAIIHMGACSATTERDFDYDDQMDIDLLRPLNGYGYSKQLFDLWVKHQATTAPAQHCGLKFFNVYGPNEYFKGSMASMIFHGYRQIREQGSIKLFKSCHPDYADGGQLRDFVYVKDVCAVILFLLNHPSVSGLFNVGTGRAQSFRELAEATFHALDLEPNIIYIDMPEHLREKYQYYTKAEMTKLQNAGYEKPFYDLEAGARDYVTGYLARNFEVY